QQDEAHQARRPAPKNGTAILLAKQRKHSRSVTSIESAGATKAGRPSSHDQNPVVLSAPSSQRRSASRGPFHLLGAQLSGWPPCRATGTARFTRERGRGARATTRRDHGR